MAKINDMILRVQQLNMNSLVEDAMYASQSALVRLQRLQLLMGRRSDGKPIGKYKNTAYAVKKAAMNPLAGGSVDLHLEGYFYEDIFVDIRSGSVIFDSGNDKTLALLQKYGDLIFGLNAEMRLKYIKENLKPTGVRLIKEFIFR